MKRILALTVLLALVLFPEAGRAQTIRVLAVYQPGWNMVGGPPGTDFSAAAGLYAWQNGAYVKPASTLASVCTGYWAYFDDATAVTASTSAGSATTQTCPLADGWNLVGNPFAAAATLPAGVIGYSWNPVAGSYLVVSSIPPGQSVWILSSGAGAVTLANTAPPSATPGPTTAATPTATPTTATPTPAATLTINYTGPSGPYQIHVGNTVRVIVPSFLQATASADPAFFQLVDAGYVYDLTCSPATCQTNPTATFLTWQAIKAGTGFITMTPTCRLANPPCAQPTQVLQFNILP